MRRDCEPAAVLLGPAIGVAAEGLLAIRRLVAGASVDDGEVAEHANPDLIGDQVPDRDRHRGLLQKSGAVDQRLVGVAAIEVLRQDLVKALDVRVLHRGDIVAIEDRQFVGVLAHGFSPLFFCHLGARSEAERTRNPYSRWWLWIPGLRQEAHPGMTESDCLVAALA